MKSGSKMAEPQNQWLLESMMESFRIQMGRSFRRLYVIGASRVPCVLICLFGLSSWLAINGLWAEMPALVPVLPERTSLPSIIVIITQISNIGGIIYLITSAVTNFVKKKRIDLEIPAVYTLILLGVVTCVLLAVFWDYTTVLFNKRHGVALLVLSFFLALVDCTSSLVYIPYMERFPDRYISALFIGEGLGALLPSLVALIQGSYKGGNDTAIINDNVSTWNDNFNETSGDGLLFGVDVFFVLLAIMTLISGAAFFLLNRLPSCRRLMVRRLSLTDKFHPLPTSRDSTPIGYVSEPNSSENSNMFGDIENSPLILTAKKKERFTFKEVIEQVKISPRVKELFSLADLMFQILWLNLLSNGAIPAVSVFVFIPYGNNTYHLATNLGIAANPIAAFVALLLPCTSRYLTVVWTLVSSIFGVAIIVLAALGHLPMVGSNWGSLIVVSDFAAYVYAHT